MQYTSYTFNYNKNSYPTGTKFIYIGKGIINSNEIVLNNVEIIWLYNRGLYEYFSYNNNTYKCLYNDFISGIICVAGEKETKNVDIVWTDNMVTKTLWYIVIMLIAVVFYDRVIIWFWATVIWYKTTFKNNK